MNLEPPPLPPPPVRKHAALAKISGICVLIALLYVPLSLIRQVRDDREKYRTEATTDITIRWGTQQRILGPVLEVPYTYAFGLAKRSVLVDGQRTTVEEPAIQRGFAYFLPEELRVEAVVDPEIRHRGIYDAVVYTTRVKLTGSLHADFAAAGINAKRIEWENAKVRFGVTDLHGLRSISPLQIGGDSRPFEAAEGRGSANWPLAARVGSSVMDSKIDFAFDAIVQGSGIVTIAPIGKTTTATLRSAWPDPSFVGAFLPTERQLNADGFAAEWNVASFNRGFPQAWSTDQASTNDVIAKIDAAAFGAKFVRGIDGYGIVERAQKYALLFLVLVFAVFFLFEVTADLRIHPVQYGMVGIALCLFFLSFLSLTEICPIVPAYLVAAAACTAMVSLYSWTFLRTGFRTAFMTGGLAATYGYLYFVLQSQDYALIAGTAALFLVMAITMYLTRRIDWYTLNNRTTK